MWDVRTVCPVYHRHEYVLPCMLSPHFVYAARWSVRIVLIVSDILFILSLSLSVFISFSLHFATLRQSVMLMMFSKPPAVVEMERVLRSRTIPAKEPESSSEQEKKKVKPAKKPKSIPNSEEPSKKSLPKEPKPKTTKRKSAKGPAKNSTKNGNVVSISFVHF